MFWLERPELSCITLCISYIGKEHQEDILMILDLLNFVTFVHMAIFIFNE